METNIIYTSFNSIEIDMKKPDKREKELVKKLLDSLSPSDIKRLKREIEKEEADRRALS